MVRAVGFLVAFVLMVQSGNAALINFGKWTFGDSTSGGTLVGQGSAYSSASNFNGGVLGWGGNAGQSYFTGGNPGYAFSTGQGPTFVTATITNTFTLPILVTQLTFDARRSTAGGFTTTLDVSDKTNLVFSTANSTWGAGSSNVFNGGSFASVLLGNGQSTTVTFNVVGGVGQSVYLDNVTISGFTTPEPASMAVFGLLGGGFVLRAYRRRRA